MIVRIHGFDWHTYRLQVMPALGNWLLQHDENSIYQMYQQTRCAQEELCVPTPLQALRMWPRAQSFVKQLPLSPHARREYQHLCSPERFTAVSDRYVYRHPPQLFQPSEALRTIWGALIETYCLPWLHLSQSREATRQPDTPEPLDQELLRLLQTGEASSPIIETNQQEIDPTTMDQERDARQGNEINKTNQQEIASSMVDQERDMDQDDEIADIEPTGVVIGRLPTPLHIRGWLATISVRAMALFELLACERRSMPFGYQPGTPFASYAGYLTPGEVQQLALCLHDVQPPNQATAVIDHQRFRQQTTTNPDFRLIDEVLPLHAAIFVEATRIAAQQQVGLICSIG